MPDPTKTPARRPGPGDLVSIKNDLGFGANVGRIRAGDKADPCPYCEDDDCREWPNVDLLDGRTVYHVPECAMETINDPTKTAARQGWAAYSPDGFIWADTFSLEESQSWLLLQVRTRRSPALMEDEGWTVREATLVVNPN